ncbi:MAG TPA: tetratricopeptide repeat protein, partial [Parasegetibacter sp.]
MRINAGFLIFAVFACQMAFAQLQTGRNFFYYERYHSAKEAFAKDAETNPEATYWLGQTMIELKDIEGAKALYQKSLTSNGNSPLILVGMGHIELLENKTSDARQRFEAAISLTKSRDIKVLNAIGRANVESRAGDNLYAIEKLNLATSIKGFKDPEVYINLGNAYRKMGDGGNAIVSYSKALSTDPKYAAARHFTGKVYLSQNNREFFIPEFEGAIAIDPAYAPSYRELYHYYYFRDVNKAIEYLEKYAANTDQTPELEYEKTSVLYAARKYQEAISQAEKIMAAKGDNYSPKYHRLLAFSYNALGDSINALKNIEIFLSRATEDILLPTDFDLLGTLQFKFPGRESQAIENIEKAIEMDTTVTKKIEYAEKVAGILDARGMLRQAADWKIKAYNFLPN